MLHKTEDIAKFFYYKKKKRSPFSNTGYWKDPVFQVYIFLAANLSFFTLSSSLWYFCLFAMMACCCKWGQGCEAGLCGSQALTRFILTNCISSTGSHLTIVNCFYHHKSLFHPTHLQDWKSSPLIESERWWLFIHFSLSQESFQTFSATLGFGVKMCFLILFSLYLQETSAVEHRMFLQKETLDKKNSIYPSQFCKFWVYVPITRGSTSPQWKGCTQEPGFLGSHLVSPTLGNRLILHAAQFPSKDCYEDENNTNYIEY